MPEVAEVRALRLHGRDRPRRATIRRVRMGHRVTLEARERGVIIRPLGDVVVLMPPLAISKADLRRLVEITAESIVAAGGRDELRLRRRRPDAQAAATPIALHAGATASADSS